MGNKHQRIVYWNFTSRRRNVDTEGGHSMSDLVRRAREELIRVGLLGETHAASVVPDLILRSWRRSICNSVAITSLSERFQQADSDSMLIRRRSASSASTATKGRSDKPVHR